MKPVRFKKIQTPFGLLATVRSFLTDSQLHSAYESYARSLNPDKLACDVTIRFEDGSTDVLTLWREDKELEYKDYDGEVYTASYHGRKWSHRLIDKLSTSIKVMVKDYAGDEKVEILSIEY